MFVNTVVHIITIIITLLTRTRACQYSHACLCLSFSKCATLVGIYLCQTNQKQPRREKQPYATYPSLIESSLSELLLNFRPMCLCRGENSAELLNEATQTKVPTLATYPSVPHYEFCIAPRFYFGICELSFRSVWDITQCHWLNASRRFGGTSQL